jgi:hypothetical protein
MTPDASDQTPSNPSPTPEAKALDAAMGGAAGLLIGRLFLGKSAGVLGGLAGAGLAYLLSRPRRESAPAVADAPSMVDAPPEASDPTQATPPTPTFEYRSFPKPAFPDDHLIDTPAFDAPAGSGANFPDPENDEPLLAESAVVADHILGDPLVPLPEPVPPARRLPRDGTARARHTRHTRSA